MTLRVGEFLVCPGDEVLYASQKHVGRLGGGRATSGGQSVALNPSQLRGSERVPGAIG